MSQAQDKPAVNRSEAAEVLGRNRRTLYDWARQGKGPPFFLINGKPYYDLASLTNPDTWAKDKA